MTWLAVARKDFRDSVRSRTLWVLSALFLLLAGGISVAYSTLDAVSGGAPTALGLMFFVASTVGTFISLAAILACYKAVAGERESGTIKILLSLPHSRRDVILGKLVGRTAVLALPAVAALLIGVVVGGALMGEFAPVATVLFGLVALLFAVAYVGIMVGLSATTGSTARAAALAVGFFVVVELLWDVLTLALVFVANDFAIPQSTADFPAWLFVVNQVPPSSSFVTSLTAVIPDAPSAAVGVGGQGAGQVEAFFATPWLGVVALVFWAVVPILIGYARFRRADL
jgi:ABC-2 type transport system permease protein